MSDITHNDPLVTESKLTEFYNDIKPFLGCPAYVTQEGDEMYYSLQEKVVGRWTDGKPLYQKTTIPSFTGSSSFNVSFDTNAVIKHYEGFVRGESNQWFPLNCTYVKSYVNNDNIAGLNTITIIGDGGRPLNEGFVTALYTKTTDSAATTIEQKHTHYTTDEQVIGAWLDGKPIYQRVIVKPIEGSTSSSTPVSITFSLADEIQNLGSVLSEKVMVRPSNSNNVHISPVYEASMTTIKFEHTRKASKDTVIYTLTNYWTTGAEAYINVQYTKTTD